jgi:hypothetical protein
VSNPKQAAERLLAEWTPDKVRIRHGDLWWRWDRCGYTYDMANAGLYAASFKTWRDRDQVVPVDPSVFAIDAIVLAQRIAEARGRAAERERWVDILEQLEQWARATAERHREDHADLGSECSREFLGRAGGLEVAANNIRSLVAANTVHADFAQASPEPSED